VVADVADGRAENQALFVGRERGGGEVRHGVLPAAQGPSVGEEVKAAHTSHEQPRARLIARVSKVAVRGVAVPRLNRSGRKSMITVAPWQSKTARRQTGRDRRDG
jgi:hypothetical protein